MNITGFCPITRRTRVEKMLQQFGGVDEILFIVDSTNVRKEYIDSLIKGKTNIRVVYTNQAPPSTFNIGQRRQRIMRIMLRMRDLIKTDYIYMLEDDTEAPINALAQLRADYNNLDSVGIVSGVQAGRWGVKMIGGWLADNPKDMKELESVKYSSYGIQDVSATGFYCFLTKTENLKYGFKVNNFGPDINFGLELSRQGFINYIDWGIITKHITDTGVVEVDESCGQIKFRLINGVWKQTIIF